MKKNGRYTIVRQDGLQLCVMRPGNPQLAIKLAREAVEANELAIARGERPAEADFDEIVQKCGGSMFVGYFGRRGMLYAIVDENGSKIGDIQPGDSFATLEGVGGEE